MRREQQNNTLVSHHALYTRQHVSCINARQHNTLVYIGEDQLKFNHTVEPMRVDLSPRLGGHTVANQPPPTTVLLSFTFIPPRNGVRSYSRCGTES